MHPNLGNPTVVLVHGAWADGSSWSRVITQLEQSGIPVTAAPIPLTSLDDDVDAVIRTIDRTEGPIVLAGHAYAGGVIGATGHPRIRAWSTSPPWPRRGRNGRRCFLPRSPHPRAPELKPDNDGWIWLPTNAFGAAFAQHATAQEHALLAAVQRPITVGSIQKPVPRPGWKDIPTWFLIAEEDRMINPDTQRFMAERTHARIHTHGVDHTPSITRPEVVTAILTEAVESIGV